ncbi:unnamed protein product [Bursaphelenchus xylophilus]|uniref:(pine wood nematode) hypothetical protein n=1 Tax=Bursaphelenchus xylophilus TaxID=6326 RepID=A0A1I7S0J5_BURXY|nr:unnamed protein product [Bursaphelenchus xylophilus]CAG9132288.1 unnamed protein product [Bursaphelenchus xylophilus]
MVLLFFQTGLYEDTPVDGVMTWSAPSPKHANVLVLLNALYTSGFATMSPTVPRLTGKTMHTLYAISFIVYTSTAFVDWIHTYAVLKGVETSFPLKDWFVVYMVGISVTGSTLNVLLIVLCVENAFAYRVHVTPYRTGLAVIWEAFVEWIHSFNNFRVAFLFAVLHDLPLTIANFFFISSCRLSGPNVQSWHIILSTISLLISLSWRMVMLYFAYRRLICPKNSTNSSNMPSRQPSFREHLEQQISFNFDLNDNGRLNDFDETWPVRWSISKVYGEYPIPKQAVLYYNEPIYGNKCLKILETAFWFAVLHISDAIKSTLKRVCCITLTLTTYICCCAVGCTPCLSYYFCRKTSLSKRHKCSKTFVRFFTIFFHYFMMFFSTISTITLIMLNLILLTSIHTIGSNTLPPEIFQVCHAVDFEHRIITPHIMPALTKLQNNTNENLRWVCKPIWANPYTRERMHDGPWQARLRINDDMSLAISTHFYSNYSAKPVEHVILYDHAILHMDRRECWHDIKSGWKFENRLNQLNWPYFSACMPTLKLVKDYLIHCPWPFNPHIR